MRFTGILLALVLLLSFWKPSTTLAQTDEYGEGVAADLATTDEVIAFLNEFVTFFNDRDSVVIELVNNNYAWFNVDSYNGAVSFLTGFASPIELYEARDVRVHDNGYLSIEVTCSGWNRAARYYTERWYLEPQGSGNYIILDALSVDTYVPKPMVAGDIGITLEQDKMTFDQTEVPVVDVLRLTFTNVEAVPYSFSLYELPENSSLAEVQERLIAENDFGLTPLSTILPVFPNEERQYGFLVEPGGAYVLQLYAYDEAITYAYALGGDQGTTLITIAEE